MGTINVLRSLSTYIVLDVDGMSFGLSNFELAKSHKHIYVSIVSIMRIFFIGVFCLDFAVMFSNMR